MAKTQDSWVLCEYITGPLIISPLLSGSFVLVEVGELQSAMNVYIFVASTSESCSMWVSTIQQAKVKTFFNKCFEIIVRFIPC